jgi:hypothetical protein
MPIDQVKIGTINNTSTAEVGYEDFSVIKTDLERGKLIQSRSMHKLIIAHPLKP